jgi:hypothetical protein
LALRRGHHRIHALDGRLCAHPRCGQHEDPSSPEVAYRAILQRARAPALVDAPAPAPVERHEGLRIEEVVDRLHADDAFTRTWASFDRVRQGEVIARRRDGTEVAAEKDGWILFPDARAAPGHEWFYLAGPMDSL